MKLCGFSITAILAAVVAANPILVPRASSPAFELWGDIFSPGTSYQITFLHVAEANYPGYYQLGWYGKNTVTQKIDLFFPAYEESDFGEPPTPSRVLDVRQNGYELAFQAVFDPEGGEPLYFRLLLVDPAKTALVGLQSPSLFSIYQRNFYGSYKGSTGGDNSTGGNRMSWKSCLRTKTTDKGNSAYVEELYYYVQWPCSPRGLHRESWWFPPFREISVYCPG